MRKMTALALSCLLVAGMFAGCRRNPATGTSTPTGMTTTATTHATQATQATQHTTHATESTRDTHVTELPTEMTTTPGVTGGTDAGRSRSMPPRY